MSPLKIKSIFPIVVTSFLTGMQTAFALLVMINFRQIGLSSPELVLMITFTFLNVIWEVFRKRSSWNIEDKCSTQ